MRIYYRTWIIALTMILLTVLTYHPSIFQLPDYSKQMENFNRLGQVEKFVYTESWVLGMVNCLLITMIFFVCIIWLHEFFKVNQFDRILFYLCSMMLLYVSGYLWRILILGFR